MLEQMAATYKEKGDASGVATSQFYLAVLLDYHKSKERAEDFLRSERRSVEKGTVYTRSVLPGAIGVLMHGLAKGAEERKEGKRLALMSYRDMMRLQLCPPVLPSRKLWPLFRPDLIVNDSAEHSHLGPVASRTSFPLSDQQERDLVKQIKSCAACV
jgi:hypothetical protein